GKIIIAYRMVTSNSSEQGAACCYRRNGDEQVVYGGLCAGEHSRYAERYNQPVAHAHDEVGKKGGLPLPYRRPVHKLRRQFKESAIMAAHSFICGPVMVSGGAKRILSP